MRRLVLAVLTPLLVLTACSGDDTEPPAFSPTLAWGDCPPDVEVTFLSRHECGILTVLANRAEPSGPTIELLVARVWPVGKEPVPGLGSSFGANVGDPRALSGGIATGTTRLGGVGVEIEWRGAGPHVDPVLRCPEVEELQPDFAAARSDDTAVVDSFVDGVRRCGERLRTEGIDPADFDATEAAADLEDLRVALEVDRWRVLGVNGSQSRYLYEYFREFPGGAGPAYLDSPWPAGVDDLTGGVLGTRAALDEVFRVCKRSAECGDGGEGSLEDSWAAALDRLALEPLVGTHRSRSGDEVDVLIDAGKLLRAARFTLGGDGPDNLTHLPQIIRDAERGRLHPKLAEIVATDPGLCFGYRPLCAGQDEFSWGVYLTSLCRDQLPFLDEERLDRAVADDPVFRSVFAESPYIAACEAWDVPPAPMPPAPAPTLASAPLLLLPGQFDSFTDRAWAEAYADGSGGSVQLLVGPAQTHNTLGFSECVISARNTWVVDPDDPITDACGPQQVPWAEPMRRNR